MLNGKIYALKEIPKLKLINHIEIFSYLQEPHILKRFTKYNFTQRIISSFQDYDNLYLITDFYEGDNLFSFKDEIMNEEQIKFISACIVQMFIYLRNEKVVHRDFSMKNLILDNDNYLVILDFSYAIKFQNKLDFNNYLICYYDIDNPPEIQALADYNYNVDYYRLGASILHFLMFKNYANAIKKDNHIEELVISPETTKDFSFQCIDFLNRLIVNDPRKRLGFNNVDELKNHPWFDGYDWEKLEKKEIKSPLKFSKNETESNICDKFYFDIEVKKAYRKISRKRIYKKLIRNYDYVNRDIVSNIYESIK